MGGTVPRDPGAFAVRQPFDARLHRSSAHWRPPTILRATVVCIFLYLCLSPPSKAQQAGVARPPSASTQVVYVIDGANLLTYNIDANFNPNHVGSFALPQATYPNLVLAPSDHFIYYTAYNSPSEQQQLWVYATDANGTPIAPATQKMNANGLFVAAVHPSLKFFYAVKFSPDGTEYLFYTIWRFLIDQNSGRLTQPLALATYTLPWGGDGSQACELTLNGFNSSGDVMYDEVACSYPFGGQNVLYSRRALNLQTGALGPDQEVYRANVPAGAGEYIQFVKDLMFDFFSPDDYQYGINGLNIYALTPDTSDTSEPLVQCTAAMQYACGYGGGSAYPSGEYVFMGVNGGAENADYETEIDAVSLKTKEIISTGSTIPSFVYEFSPDATIAYTFDMQGAGYAIGICGFDAETAKVTIGGMIGVPSGVDPFFVTERR